MTEYSTPGIENEDKKIILESIANRIFKNSPKQKRNVEIIKLYQEGLDKSELALKFNIKELRVNEVIKQFTEVRANQSEVLADAERWRIFELIREYKL